MGQVASNVEGVPATPQKITNVRATPPVIEDPSFDNDSVSGDEQSNGPVNVVPKSRGPPKPETTIPKMKKGKIRKFKEDEIDQDQENRDLLAYMQIVGENASQLPYTWRDDPLLGRTVSTLTAKEYAKKADAFIPCDIRVIGSTSNALDRTVEREISDVSTDE